MQPCLRHSVVLLLLLSSIGCGSGGDKSAGDPSPDPAAALQPASEISLTSYFRNALQQDSSYATFSTKAAPPVPPPMVATAGEGAAAGFSTTTLQESGVDEADLVKTDGSVIYSIRRVGAAGSIRRHQVPAGGTALKLIEDYAPKFGADVALSGLYLDTARRQVAALAQGSFGGYIDLWFAPQAWRTGVTELLLLDVFDPATTRQRYKLRLDGQVVGTRRIDTTLYLVLRSYPRIPGLDYTWAPANADANRKMLATLEAKSLLPSVQVDSQPAQPLVVSEDCLVQTDNAFATADVITIVGVDLAGPTPRHASRCFVGSSEALYVSERSLYLATTRTAYNRASLAALYPAQNSTDIHKFALNGLSIAYRGSGQVEGHLGWDQNRKSFRFGEQGDYLRVITFTGASQVLPTAIATPAGAAGAAGSAGAAPAATDSPATLSILQEAAGRTALGLVSKLPNENRPAPLGKVGEQIYATRFLGDRGYLVTYRLTDPLYVLDLSNPLDPKLAGELQVSGYSDYLFPLTENLLLGVGKEAVSDGGAGDGRFAWYQGVKLSLIDVTQPATPRETAKLVIGRRGTEATVLRDHHGIAIQAVGGIVRVAMPVNLHDKPPARASGAPSDYYGYTHTALYRFELDTAANRIVERTPMIGPPGSVFEPPIQNDRSVLVGDQVHYLRNFDFVSGAW